MKLATTRNNKALRDRSAFTLAEVLAALVFMAIVIPVAIQVLHVSSLAGEVAARKGEAARVCDRILSEELVTTNWNGGAQNGNVTEGSDSFTWTVTTQTWPQDQMEQLTAEVKFQAQGHDYSVKMSTLANQQNQTTPASTTVTAMR
ncbi:MAG TPA: type II secretion system protein [Verrucomicrobiae bacterium]|jgi:type II secretory pathway pseudopilin PulG